MDSRIQAVQNMQNYIEAHLGETISFGSIARASGFSPWYARRLFVEHTGLTPAQYTRKLRLSRSVLRLRDEKVTVLDVAMDMGFGSVDGFQRAFQREFGRNPKAYAVNPVPLPLFTPYGVKFKNPGRREKNMAARNVFVQVMDKPPRKVIIKRGVKAREYWAYCEEVGCDVWGLLTSIKSLAGEPVCLWLPQKYILPGTSEYVQGVEVDIDYAGPVPDGFDVITLPAAKYLLFQGEPFAEEAFGDAIEELWEAEEKYDPSLLGFAWDDANPKIQLEPIGARGYIELLAVK